MYIVDRELYKKQNGLFIPGLRRFLVTVKKVHCTVYNMHKYVHYTL